MFSAKEMINLYPDEILEECSCERRRKLEKAKDPVEFIKILRELATSCRPIWAFGLHRSGSTWLGKYFLNSFSIPVYKEPFDLFQSPGQKETAETLHAGSAGESPRPQIQQELGLTRIPLDRLILAIHDRFWFYHHLDSAIIPELDALYPNSRFMFWCRDLRDIVDSYAYPVTDHWPPKKFPYLGDDPKERFLNAILRLSNWIKSHLTIVREYQERIYWGRYEDFSADFISAGKSLLDYLEVNYQPSKLTEQANNFSARHGMWKNWEPWELGVFYYTDIQNLNRILGYGTGKPNASHVWQRPIDKNKIPPREEIQNIINKIQS